MFGLSRKHSRYQGFWQWLADNTAHIQSASEKSFAALTQQLAQAFDAQYPGLTWEISPAKSGPWTFCISADGNRELFERVRQAVDAAPEIPGWEIQAFRPRGSLSAVLKMGGRKLGYEDLWCSVKPHAGAYAVTLWIRGLDEETDRLLSGAALVLLDNAIGEYDAATKISHLDRRRLPPDPQETATFFPLSLLPAYLDALDEP